MPIYEFYCDQCNVIFNFFSSRIDTQTRPDCPRCGKARLERRISTFATIGKAKESGDDPLAGLDEAKMEQAFGSLMREAEGVTEDDPRRMASLMHKFSDMTGIRLGGSMEEALARMERGEDPERIEQEMGDLLAGDDAFSLEGMKKAFLMGKNRPPVHDEKLYELKVGS